MEIGNSSCYLLGGLLLLLLGGSFILFRFSLDGGFLNRGFFLLLLLLLGNKKTNDILGLDHVVLIDLELSEDVVNLSGGELVSPGHESVLEHTSIDLSLEFVSLEGLDNEIIGVVAISGHLGLEHL